MNASLSQRRNQGKKHQWNVKEDAILIGCLLDLKNDPMWRKEGSNFKAGFLLQLEKMMANKIPNCSIKAHPHIQSRFKLLKRQYGAIYDMLNTSGFGWDDTKKCITCDQDVWNNWVKSHSQASGLRNKPFLYLEELSIIFRKDRATGQRAEGPADAAKEILTEEMNSEEEVQFVDPIEFESNNSISQTHIGHVQQSAFLSRSRKRKASNEEEVAFTSTLIKTTNNLEVMCQSLSKGIDKLADCFRFLANDQEMKKKVYKAIAEIEDLGLHESSMVKAGFIIARDSVHKISGHDGAPWSPIIQRDRLPTAKPGEEQFRKFSLNIPRPREETLSRHSILGPNGLHGQWKLPIIDRGIQYPSNLDLSPIQIPS